MSNLKHVAIYLIENLYRLVILDRRQGVEDSNKRRTPFRSEMPQLLSYQHSILTTLKVDVH